MSIKFLRAGPQTSTQDQGRSGLAHLGVPRGGALDRGAMQTANWLVGNTDNQPVLEFSMAGPSLLSSRIPPSRLQVPIYHPSSTVSLSKTTGVTA